MDAKRKETIKNVWPSRVGDFSSSQLRDGAQTGVKDTLSKPKWCQAPPQLAENERLHFLQLYHCLLSDNCPCVKA